MLEVSSLRSPSKGDHQRGFVGDHVGLFPTSGGGSDCDDCFMAVDDNLLEYIDFSCCDVPFFDADGDILPDLEVDPTDEAELLAEFSSPDPETTTPAADDDGKPPPDVNKQQQVAGNQQSSVREEEEKAADEIDDKLKQGVLEKHEKKAAAAGVTTTSNNKKKKGGIDEGSSAVTAEEDSSGAAAGSDTKSSASGKKKASAAAAGKDSNGKRKVKVDWTPELHRRFVQAVEQLGIDKAVPSRILEIMGIECLTRHNIASHLQKYRSHRKHLMAREAEAATWAQKRHSSMYAASAAPWVVPTTIVGFPPPPFCRPLHVWGHPPAAAAAEAPPPAMWPRHLVAAPPRPWAPMMDPAAAYWNQQHNVRGQQEVGSTSSGSMPDAAARHGPAALQVSGAAADVQARRPSATAANHDDRQAARRIAASARRAPVQGEHRRSHWRCFSEAMAAASAGSQAALPPQRHVRAAQARHTKGPTGLQLHRLAHNHNYSSTCIYVQ
ncbi:unnamed protein product [Urochloa humidicola]